MTTTRIHPVELHPTGPLPLLVGLEGPPGGGKTFSALRLAKGVQEVRSGPIRLIDTEAGRSAAYRAQIEFGLVRLDPPYRPTRFLEAIQELILLDQPSCIIIDSLSDEHEGEGGVLEWHEAEIDRRLGPDKNNWPRREAVSMAGWIVPKAARNRLIGGLLRITTPIVVTFRAREKTRPIRDASGKTVITKMGYQAIAPAEICHAMTAMCLLPPHADGKPVWKSEEAGQDFLLKRPNFLQAILTDAQLDETTGARLATWAQGPTSTKLTPPPGELAQALGSDLQVQFMGEMAAKLEAAATVGYQAFRKAWNDMCNATTKEVRAPFLAKRQAWIMLAHEADERSKATNDKRQTTNADNVTPLPTDVTPLPTDV